MSTLYRDHPQVFDCRCGAKHLAQRVREVPEGDDGWYGHREHYEFFDWFAPDKAVARCGACGSDLIAVYGERAKPRDAVFVEGRRVV